MEMMQSAKRLPDQAQEEVLGVIELFAKKLRAHALKMTHHGSSSHIGSILSIADILAALYGHFLQVRPEEPKWPDRDRFILSKGHAGAGVYAALAIRGFLSEEILTQHYQDGSIFSGHVSHKGVPGVEFSTGSLGHGLSAGTGMAYAGKLAAKKHRVCVLMSDGEQDEGSNWEAVLFASHHKLDNLIAVIDCNNLQSLDTVENTLNIEPLADKWQSFGWHVQEIDGHNIEAIIFALENCTEFPKKPHCIIARTTKGKGVPFMENQVLWHYRSPDKNELAQALTALEVPQ